MTSSNQKFYGNPFIGFWQIPSTGELMYPGTLRDNLNIATNFILSEDNQLAEKTTRKVKVDWVEDEFIKNKSETLKFWPWIAGERLNYDEEQ